WVLEEGSVQIYTNSFDGSDLVLRRLEAGQSFGEHALLPGGTGRRTASARALEDCRLLELSREAISAALEEKLEILSLMGAKRAEHRLSDDEKLRAAVFSSLGVVAHGESYRIESYPAGAAIFREGDPGDRVYLILKGRALVKQTAHGQSVVLAEL